MVNRTEMVALFRTGTPPSLLPAWGPVYSPAAYTPPNHLPPARGPAPLTTFPCPQSLTSFQSIALITPFHTSHSRLPASSSVAISGSLGGGEMAFCFSTLPATPISMPSGKQGERVMYQRYAGAQHEDQLVHQEQGPPSDSTLPSHDSSYIQPPLTGSCLPPPH